MKRIIVSMLALAFMVGITGFITDVVYADSLVVYADSLHGRAAGHISFNEKISPETNRQNELLSMLFWNTPEEMVALIENNSNEMTMLFEYNPQGVAMLNAFDFDIENIVVPNVVAMGSAETDDCVILIAFDSEVTPEAMDFVLAFTGIPAHRANFDQLLGFRSNVGTLDLLDEVELINGFHPNFLENSYEFLHPDFLAEIAPDFVLGATADYALEYNSDVFQPDYLTIGPRVVSGGILSMGELIILDNSLMTLGHPDASGTRFFTAPHRVVPHFAQVNLNRTNSQIGRATRSFYGINRDFAEVAVSAGLEVSRRAPSGRNITNFRGTAVAGLPATSIRGLSGLVSVRVHDTNAAFQVNGVQWSNMILAYPDGRSQVGDSGAALIQTIGTGENVIGTRQGSLHFVSGTVKGIYTRVQNY